MEEATLSPRAHMALLDGPERNTVSDMTQMRYDTGTNKPNENNVNVLWIQSGLYLRMIFPLCSTAQAVWDFLKHDPNQPTQPVNSDTHRYLIIYRTFCFIHR